MYSPRSSSDDIDARMFQRFVEVDFLRSHAFRFDDGADFIFLGDIQDVSAGLLGIPGDENAGCRGPRAW